MSRALPRFQLTLADRQVFGQGTQLLHFSNHSIICSESSGVLVAPLGYSVNVLEKHIYYLTKCDAWNNNNNFTILQKHRYG